MKKLLEKIRQNKSGIMLYAMLFVVCIILSRASVIGVISPFGFSFAFSLIHLQKNAILVSICYFFASILFNLSLNGLLTVFVTASCMILLFLFFKIIKKRINFFSTIIFLVLSQSAYLYFNIKSLEDIFTSVAMIVVAILFVYVCSQTFGALFFRGISSRLTLDESICLSIFLIALFSGLSGIYISSVNISSGIITLLILLSARVFNKTTTIYFSLLAGFGVAFATASVVSVALFATYGVLASTMSDKSRFFAPILIFSADAVLGLFFGVHASYTLYSVLPLAVAVLVYICIPQKVFNYFKGFSYNYSGSLSGEYILSGQQQSLKKRLEKTSSVFKLMQSAYVSLSMGEIDHKSVASALADELFSRHCKNCVLFEQCFANENIKKSLCSLFEFGLSKGKVTMIDASNLLTGTCRCLSATIEEANSSLENYFEFEKAMKSEDSNKLLVGEQLGGASEMLSELAKMTFEGEKVNEKLSKALLDEFTVSKVVVNEALVLENDEGVRRVIIAVKNSDALNSNLTLCLKSVLKLNFVATSRQMTRLAGWSIVCFSPASRYKVQVGYSAEGKEKVSGDTYGLVSLGSGKYLFALSDGMGHGEKANRISTATLGLVEGFYKAGFSSNTILGAVNKLLVPAIGENFACLDACIVDTSLGTADFIKVGASISLVKSKDTTKIIEGSALPLGIVKRVTTSSSREILKDQDIIVVASDGIVDAFASFEEYSNYVNNERLINVQMLADTILEEAQSRVQDHKDDMSVITIKLVACV